MTNEIEVTVLDIDKKQIENKLKELSAEKIQDTRLIVDWYRIKGIKEGEDPWFLRIRSNSEGKHEVTWKAKSSTDGIARKHKEINFLIEEPNKLKDLFEEFGLEKYAHQEKDRVSYKFQDWNIDIDTYPKMPPYLEVEGNDGEHIKNALKLFNIENNRTWNKGERILIQDIYHLDWYNMNF
jgi:adenylate cyclase class 2